MTAKTLSDAVRKIIADATYRAAVDVNYDGVANRANVDNVMAKLGPLLEAAEIMRKYAGKPPEPRFQNWDAAVAALTKDTP